MVDIIMILEYSSTSVSFKPESPHGPIKDLTAGGGEAFTGGAPLRASVASVSCRAVLLR